MPENTEKGQETAVYSPTMMIGSHVYDMKEQESFLQWFIENRPMLCQRIFCKKCPGMKNIIHIKDNAGELYANHLVKRFSRGPVDFDEAYLERQRMHWLKDHEGKVGINMGDPKPFISGFQVVIVGGSEGLVPKCCLEEVA